MRTLVGAGGNLLYFEGLFRGSDGGVSLLILLRAAELVARHRPGTDATEQTRISAIISAI
jgi:hypothetical protein